MQRHFDQSRRGPDSAAASRTAPRRIGLDFDNTIICYDALFVTLARRRGLIGPDVPANKRAVRDALRLLPEGERLWQLLQAEAYGPLIDKAEPSPGVETFLDCGTRCGATFFIVSHKSRYATQDAERCHDLVAAAQGWLAARGIVGDAGPVRPADVFFEASRAEKVARITQLGCTAFIDDLEETFAEPSFPADTRAILIDGGGLAGRMAGIRICRSWADVTAAVFVDGA
jgi:hypothetical protein